MRPHLTVEQPQLALRLKARGLSLGCSHQGVALVVRQASWRSARHEGRVPGPGRLTLADREEITIGHGRRPPAPSEPASLQVLPCTCCREHVRFAERLVGRDDEAGSPVLP